MICLYGHAVMLYKLMTNTLFADKFIQLIFQLNDNPRLRNLNFTKLQKYEKNELRFELFFAETTINELRFESFIRETA